MDTPKRLLALDGGGVRALITTCFLERIEKTLGERHQDDSLYASAAAPFYFVPEQVAVGEGETGAFVDGGVSMANNPAWLMYLKVTLQGFNCRWRSGENDLFVCSVGTGQWRQKDDWWPTRRVGHYGG